MILQHLAQRDEFNEIDGDVNHGPGIGRRLGRDNGLRPARRRSLPAGEGLTTDRNLLAENDLRKKRYPSRTLTGTAIIFSKKTNRIIIDAGQAISIFSIRIRV
jgi:hypothetical protein